MDYAVANVTTVIQENFVPEVLQRIMDSGEKEVEWK